MLKFDRVITLNAFLSIIMNKSHDSDNFDANYIKSFQSTETKDVLDVYSI